MDVEAGLTGHVPQTFGHGPGVRTEQESRKRSVSEISFWYSQTVNILNLVGFNLVLFRKQSVLPMRR